MIKDLQTELNSIPKFDVDIYKPTPVLISKDMEILLVESHKNPGHWKGMGGRIEEGETILECIKREMLEEFGTDNFEVIANIGRTGPHFAMDDPDKTLLVDFYLLKLDRAELKFNYSENKSFKWFSIEDAKTRVGEISERMSVDAINCIEATDKSILEKSYS